MGEGLADQKMVNVPRGVTSFWRLPKSLAQRRSFSSGEGQASHLRSRRCAELSCERWYVTNSWASLNVLSFQLCTVQLYQNRNRLYCNHATILTARKLLVLHQKHALVQLTSACVCCAHVVGVREKVDRLFSCLLIDTIMYFSAL